MPQNIFNLYAAQVFSEQSMAVWPLDDDFSYLSLISASPAYSLTNAVSASVANPPTEKPQETVGVADVSLNIDSFTGTGNESEIRTQSFSVPEDIDTEKPTVCISSFIYTYDTDVSELEIGFEYNSNYYTKTYNNLDLNSWTKIEHTMDLPDSNTTVTPYIKIKHYGEDKTYSLYQTSVGQWSEQYNDNTQGTVPIPFENISSSASIMDSIGEPISASPSIFSVCEIDEYGFSTENTGYYFIENNHMLASNSSLPMVYGSGDITEVYPSEYGMPSLIFPSQGFMHSFGQYSSITADFWLKIYPSNTTKKKIFGPVSTDDGLYVDKDFITIRVGPYEKSYFIHKWYRPMLVSIIYTPTLISLLINGETVIEQQILLRDINFETDLNKQWIGFYSHSDINKFEIDSLAIYPYAVSNQMSKRRFVFGQGVGNAQEITSKFGSTSVPINFSFSGYANNLIYPDMTKWYAGFYSNIDASSRYLSLPSYELPTISYLGNDLSAFVLDRSRKTWATVLKRTWDQWTAKVWGKISSVRENETLFDNFENQADRTENIYLKLRPNSEYDNVYGSLIFSSMNIINETIFSTIGVFSLNQSEVQEKESGSEINIMNFKNNATGDVFKIIFDDSVNKIKYMFNAVTIKEFDFIPQTEDTFFIIGMNIETLTNSFARIIKRFFSDQQNIQLSIGGFNTNQFTGKIYRVNFNNKFFTKKDINEYFDSDGFASYNDDVKIFSSNEILSYVSNYTLFFTKSIDSLIMDIASAGYWEDSIPMSYFGKYIKSYNGTNNVYDLDFIQFNIDYPSLFYSNGDLDEERIVKIYVSLQKYEDVGQVSYSNYTVVKELDDNRYIDFENIDSDIDITKFNIVDGTIIFAPKQIIDFNDAYLTVHMEIKDPGIGTNPMKIQRMSLSSLAYDQGSLYELNSPTGNKLYPFTRQGSSYITRAKNPYLIYKDETPYLYLTADSGIQSLPYEEIESVSGETFRRGISIPVNNSKAADYNLYGIHMWAFYNESNLFTETKNIFSFYYQQTKYDVYLEPETGGKRAKLVAYKYIGTSQVESDVILYQNGIKQNVYIYPTTWSLITMRFENPITISNIRGQLEIYQGMVVNNITFFENDINKRVDDIFESHLGLSNIVSQDDTTVTISFDESLFNDVVWTSFSGKPI